VNRIRPKQKEMKLNSNQTQLPLRSVLRLLKKQNREFPHALTVDIMLSTFLRLSKREKLMKRCAETRLHMIVKLLKLVKFTIDTKTTSSKSEIRSARRMLSLRLAIFPQLLISLS